MANHELETNYTEPGEALEQQEAPGTFDKVRSTVFGASAVARPFTQQDSTSSDLDCSQGNIYSSAPEYKDKRHTTRQTAGEHQDHQRQKFPKPIKWSRESNQEGKTIRYKDGSLSALRTTKDGCCVHTEVDKEKTCVIVGQDSKTHTSGKRADEEHDLKITRNKKEGHVTYESPRYKAQILKASREIHDKESNLTLTLTWNNETQTYEGEIRDKEGKIVHAFNNTAELRQWLEKQRQIQAATAADSSLSKCCFDGINVCDNNVIIKEANQHETTISHDGHISTKDAEGKEILSMDQKGSLELFDGTHIGADGHIYNHHTGLEDMDSCEASAQSSVNAAYTAAMDAVNSVLNAIGHLDKLDDKGRLLDELLIHYYHLFGLKGLCPELDPVLDHGMQEVGSAIEILRGKDLAIKASL